ncbi:hypothetical protein P3X46_019844 [Hevea brasiliensis]|uniref:Auxin-responsive protein n=1 Tax=Hevea brasiliensis TaxID=3981 RepID=A0ABQ9LK10_HEVBR|nr:auxin-responsive protein IAA2 [Hevea brasiliensis]KAJ9168301.1 hypothetical protein P3X46_019844 [Hevea brasiliensis]
MEEHTDQFFNLIPKQEEWSGSQKLSEDKKLELRLGPPGDFLSIKNITNANGIKRFLDADRSEAKTGDRNWFINTYEKQCKKLLGYEGSDEKVFSSPWLPSSGSLHSSTFQRETQREIIQPKPSYLRCSTAVELQCPDKKLSSGPASASFPPTTAGTPSPHKRVAPAPVVGWPPVRSFRKNLASSSNSKQADANLPNKTPTEGCTVKPGSFRNDLFVKINMEGVPIGRKINLNAYDSYEKLSVAIDELFRGLLAAQRENSTAMIDEAKANSGLSGSGSGEYTLVYEDNEGDRILVGDVPWHMFVSTAKRLRVLKSSELSTPQLSVGSGEQEKTPLNSLVEIGR